ncbi:MAG TPA: type II and III secretion system protein family protein [Allosphingosinicella sp.]|jgi:pilus assembly protein CpaC
MSKVNIMRRATVGTAIVAIVAAALAGPVSAPALAQPAAVRPSSDVTLSVGTGRMVRLDTAMTDLFVANDSIADVQVRSANQIYIFGKSAGETTVFATDRAGRTVYSANVRVGTNIGSLDELLRLAMPDAQIQARPINGMVLLTGTVAAPSEVEEATRLVQAYVGEGTQVLSRLKSAVPLQVMLQVKIAEVSRSLVRDIGVNLENLDPTGGNTGFVFGRGRDVGNWGPAGTTMEFTRPTSLSSIGLRLNNLFGLNVAGALDLNENNGIVTMLAEPTLTAVSGETASFLAGGEFPIPTASGLNGTSVEFKQYGVSLAFTPTVLEGGSISMRVRPEVSELSSAGAIKLNGFEIPGLTTRRTETTVQLGSGQSFMIGGLLRNGGNNSIERTPGLGNLPIIGTLFRSNSFRRNETELVIVVTPYLVRPVNANQIALPTDGFRSATTSERVMLGQEQGRGGAGRPGPTVAEPQTAPGMGGLSAAPAHRPAAPEKRSVQRQQATRPEQPSAAPGFSF